MSLIFGIDHIQFFVFFNINLRVVSGEGFMVGLDVLIGLGRYFYMASFSVLLHSSPH